MSLPFEYILGHFEVEYLTIHIVLTLLCMGQGGGDWQWTENMITLQFLLPCNFLFSFSPLKGVARTKCGGLHFFFNCHHKHKIYLGKVSAPPPGLIGLNCIGTLMDASFPHNFVFWCLSNVPCWQIAKPICILITFKNGVSGAFLLFLVLNVLNCDECSKGVSMKIQRCLYGISGKFQ